MLCSKILTKFNMVQIFSLKIPHIKFHRLPYIGSRLVSCRRTEKRRDRHDDAVANILAI